MLWVVAAARVECADLVVEVCLQQREVVACQRVADGRHRWGEERKTADKMRCNTPTQLMSGSVQPLRLAHGVVEGVLQRSSSMGSGEVGRWADKVGVCAFKR